MVTYWGHIPNVSITSNIDKTLLVGAGQDGKNSNIYICELSNVFLISNLRHVLNFLCFLLGYSPASECYMLTFWNTLSVPPS